MKVLKKITFYLIVIVTMTLLIGSFLRAMNYEAWYNDNYMILNDGDPDNDPVFSYPYKG